LVGLGAKHLGEFLAAVWLVHAGSI
jgi:hypothetical protein